jgi:GNAT superfamily N-acetyltransferase
LAFGHDEWVTVLCPERLDEPAGEALLAAFIDEIVPLYPGWRPDTGPSATPDELSPPSGLFLVAYVGNEPVGCGGIKRLSTTAAELKRLYVAPKVRNQGVARALIAGLEDAARDAGYRVVRLDTGAQQPGAVQLFRSAGYSDIGDYNGNPYASYWFEKVL